MANHDRMPRTRSMTGGAALAVLGALVGVLLGVGGYTFFYAEGLSYMSTDPKACVNCHIMRPQYDSWQKSSHHNVAKCVDCHLPHDFIGKYIAKSENGYHHSMGFHAPQEAAKVLGEAADLARQGQVAAINWNATK